MVSDRVWANNSIKIKNAYEDNLFIRIQLIPETQVIVYNVLSYTLSV